MFFKFEDAKRFSANPDAQRVNLACGGSLMAARWDFKEGASLAPHSHVHEQIAYVIEGEFEFTINGENHLAKAGDSLYFPSNIVHGGRCLKKGSLLDVFTPQREDLK